MELWDDGKCGNEKTKQDAKKVCKVLQIPHYIVNLKDEFIKPLGFNRKDFGVRVTSNDYLQNIISITGPLLASSCNITGYKPCRNMKEIEDQFKNTNINVVVDSEAIDIPSTIIDLTSDEIKIIR